MPRIWTDSIDTHRQRVHEAILAAAADLAAERGPLALTMSSIAERAGIGRATLYKYFPDIESILLAWHRREFTHHLEHLESLGQDPDVTLHDLAHFIAALRQRHPHFSGVDAVGSLAQRVAGIAEHGGDESGHDPSIEVLAVLTDLLTRMAQRGQVRRDHPAELLAQWLLYGVHAPAALDASAVAELVTDSLARRSARSP